MGIGIWVNNSRGLRECASPQPLSFRTACPGVAVRAHARTARRQWSFFTAVQRAPHRTPELTQFLRKQGLFVLFCLCITQLSVPGTWIHSGLAPPAPQRQGLNTDGRPTCLIRAGLLR